MPPESGVAVAAIELLPENVELLVVVHDVVGDEFRVVMVSSEPVTDLPLESVTVTWKMYEAFDHVVVSNEKVAPVSESSL